MIELPEDPRGRELLLMVERAKYERWLSQEIGDILSRAFNQVVDTILSPTFRTLSASERARTLQLARELDRVIQQGYSTARVTTLREMTGYATLERDIAAAQIQSMLTGSSDQLIAGVGVNLTRAQLTSIAELPVQGLTINDWFEAQAAGMSRETRRLIQNGLLQGKSIPEMVRSIVPPKMSIEPALYRQARSNSFSIIRTTVNAVQNNAAVQSYRAAGNDTSDSFKLSAVRDARTTAICRALDGLVQRNDNPNAKRPPFHIGCRTTCIPIVNARFLARSVQTQPLTFDSYNDWLKAQTGSLQDTILGPARADYWRRGKMTLADAIDEDQRVLTLPQLRKRLGLETVRQPAGAF
jgi:SPP1 gp7 family putative phage head morphogenesis protein